MGKRQGTHCERCGVVDLSRRHSCARFCDTCQPARFADIGGTAAHKAVNKAVRAGILPKVSTQVCVDCGKPACDYDHRDYGKPLEVDPVCRSCNRRRGPARPVLDLELPIPA